MTDQSGCSTRRSPTHRRRSQAVRPPLRQRQRGWRTSTSQHLLVPNTAFIYQYILSERQEAHKSRLWILDACYPMVAKILLEQAI